MWYACAACGRPNSSDGEHFCGKCEREYHEQQQRYTDEEIARLSQEMKNCKCQANGPDEPCGKCYRRTARIYSLQGREDMAEAILNG